MKQWHFMLGIFFMLGNLSFTNQETILDFDFTTFFTELRGLINNRALISNIVAR